MPEEPLQLRLEQTDQRPGQYTLTTCNTWQYPVMLNSERDVALNEWLRRLQPVLIGNTDPSGDLSPQELMRNVGTWLWHALLPDNAPAQQREALAHALRSGRTPLLLELPTALSGLPWELLCDPQQPAEQGFLARRRPLLRFIASDTEMPPIIPPLRVLLLISSPPSLGENSRVDVESERAAVEQTLYQARANGLLHLRVEDIVTRQRVQEALTDFQPHMVHYIGHGGYSAELGGMLLWEDERGEEAPISAVQLAELLGPQNLHAVVLHACQTGRSNARMDVHGVAGTLVKEGIPIVLAQQANFTYESSQRASKAWYSTLTAGRDCAEALFKMRQALWQADRPDWAVPILYASSASLTPLLEKSVQVGAADPLLSSPGVVADLPAPTGVFVGRHREMRALHLMLESIPGSGPVMALITGPGGIGKSTLAAQAVTRYGRTYKATLTLSCAGYQSVDLFLQRIGEFLKRLSVPGFLEQTLPDPRLRTEAKIEEAIVALNLAGPVLLVIDNLESVQDKDQMLQDEGLLYLLQKLLTNLRSGRVLITGRYVVKNLLPQGKFAANLWHLDLDDLSPYETNQLLIRYPTLAVLRKIVHEKLVQEFGGLPYVYDLLSSEAASQNLDVLISDVQGYITQGHKQRTAEEWQKVRREVVEFAALEAIIKYLSEAARTLLGLVSVLQQPFPLAAMEQGLGTEQAVWQLLLDRSLLRYDQVQQRYHLHSLTRRYAEETLLDAQNRRQAQEQLAIWYQRYAKEESHDLADALEAYRLLHAVGKVQQAGQMVLELVQTLTQSGLYPLLQGLCTKTLGDIGEGDNLLKARILSVLGDIDQYQGKYEQAHRHYQQSLDISEWLGDGRECASSLHQLGMIAQRQAEYEQARNLYRQSLDISERLGNQRECAISLHQLGIIAQNQGEYEQARSIYQQNLNIFKELDDEHGCASSLHQLGIIAQNQGEYEQARKLHQQSLEIKERLGDQRGRSSSLHQLGITAQRQGEYEQAYRFHQQSLDIDERLGNQSGCATSLHVLGIIAQQQGEYEQARTFYQRSLDIRERLNDKHGRASSLHQLGMIAQRQGEYEQASLLHQQSLDIFEHLDNQSERANALYQLGNIAQHREQYEQAMELYQQSLDIFKRLDDKSGQAGILHQLGNIAQNQEQYEQASTLYRQSLKIDEQLGDQHGRANSLGELGLLAYKQGNFEHALTYTVQAYITLDVLRSPSSAIAKRQIARIRNHMEEATFITHWRALAGDYPLLILSAEDTQQLLRQVLIEFLNTPTWDALKHFLESHPELLQLEIDVLLQELTVQQEQDVVRKRVEERGLLLALCRDKGIDAAFAELQAAQDAQSTPLDEASQQEEGNHD